MSHVKDTAVGLAMLLLITGALLSQSLLKTSAASVLHNIHNLLSS